MTRPIWDEFEDVVREVPDEQIARLPVHGSRDHDFVSAKMTTRVLDDFDLAWEEHGVSDRSPELWRLAAEVTWKTRRQHRINWFASERAATEYAARLADRGGKVIQLSHYILES